MNALKQQENFILGSQEAIDELSKKKEAHILLLSDSHGNAETVEFIIQHYADKQDAIIFSGDGISDLILYLEKATENSTLMKKVPPVIAFVKGNNDPYHCFTSFDPSIKKSIFEEYYPDEDSKYPPLKIPKEVVFTAAGKTIYVTHGNEQGVYYSTSIIESEATNANAQIAIFGHTHYPYDMHQQVYMVNPGSLSLPRQNSLAGFAILHIVKNNVFTLFYGQDARNKNEFKPYVPTPIY